MRGAAEQWVLGGRAEAIPSRGARKRPDGLGAGGWAKPAHLMNAFPLPSVALDILHEPRFQATKYFTLTLFPKRNDHPDHSRKLFVSVANAERGLTKRLHELAGPPSLPAPPSTP